MTGLLPILRAAASGRALSDPAVLDSGTVRWAVQTGLGPLTCHLGNRMIAGLADVVARETLRGADLTARLSMAETLDALEEILAACADMSREIILLKGISACLNLYPEPHLRTLGDIDLLLPVQSQRRFETILHALGYRQQSSHPPDYYRTHHHSMPFFHPARQVWVEVHVALFSNTPVAADPVFSPPRLYSQTVPVDFRGYKTNRFCPELELVYFATHWALERKCSAGGAIPFLDLIYLVGAYGRELDWDRLPNAPTSRNSAACLYLMLRYLERNEIVLLPSGIMQRLASNAGHPFRPGGAILHKLIDRYTMNGRPFARITSAANVNIVWDTLLTPGSGWRNLLALPWHILFPPALPHRFDPAFQLARLSRVLGIRNRK